MHHQYVSPPTQLEVEFNMFPNNIHIYRLGKISPQGVNSALYMTRVVDHWFFFDRQGPATKKWYQSCDIGHRFCLRAMAEGTAIRLNEDEFFEQTDCEYLRSAAELHNISCIQAPLAFV